MGYYTNFTLKAPDAFLKLWDNLETGEAKEHVDALQKLGIEVELGKRSFEMNDRVTIAIDADGDPILTIDDYEFESDGNRFYVYGKFYEHPSAFKEISSKVPGLFILDGVGEDGDSWRAYFRAGKSYTARPVFPAFDETKLK